MGKGNHWEAMVWLWNIHKNICLSSDSYQIKLMVHSIETQPLGDLKDVCADNSLMVGPK